MLLLSRARNSGISDPVKEARREARHTARAAHAVGVDARRAKRDRRRDLSGLVAEAHKRWTTAMEAQFVPGCDDVANGVEIKESRAAWDALRDEAVLIGK